MDKYPGLYIHIPFCKRKCRYCDFVSYVGKEAYISAYLNSLEKEAEQYDGQRIQTLFIGGGTPTALNVGQLENLMKIIRNHFDLSPCVEATIEANPGTITEEKLKVLSHYGINRISIGVQSFSDEELKMLGRIHSSKEALEAIELSKKYSDNVSIDLMTALPNQTESTLMKSLAVAVNSGITHISCYSLILEDGTEMKRLFDVGELTVPNEDSDREMYESLCSYLAKSGFARYEISNFAKDGMRCAHNMKYWTANEYIGLGAAAHSYFGGKRFFNTSSLCEYLSGEMKHEYEEIQDTDEKKEEYIMLSLRTVDGVNLQEYKDRFSSDFYDEKSAKIDKFITHGLMKKTAVGYGFTDKGFDISNAIICELI